MDCELNRFVKALPGMAWTALPDGQIDCLNQRWCQFTGLALHEASGWGWLTAIHPDDLPNLRVRWQAILASGQPGEIEARLRRCDGEYRWFLFSGSPLRDAAGQITRWCGLSSDIGNRIGTEDALRHARSQIVDGIPTPVALMTPDGQVELVNRQVLEYFGKTAEELKGWTSSDAVHPDDLPQVTATWRIAVETGRAYEVESRHRRADGVYRWFRVNGFPLRDRDGRISRWYVLQTDVDDRKRAEILFAGENRLLEMMARGEPLAATLTELCRLVEALCSNCACCSILRLDPETKRLWHVASPHVPEAYTESIDGFAIGPEVSSCGTAAHRGEQVIAFDIATDPRWADFREVALENGLRACWSTPIFSQQHRVLGTFAMFSRQPASPTADDQKLVALVTHLGSIAMERAVSDAALKQSEARKAAILGSALDCIMTVNHEGRITEFNPAAERTFGYRRAEVVGKMMDEVIFPPAPCDGQQQGLARYLALGERPVLGQRVEMTAVRSGGAEFPVEVAITRIAIEGPPAFSAYLRDITDRREAERNLRRSAAYLAEAQALSRTGSFRWSAATDDNFWSAETFRIFEYDPATQVTLQRVFDRVHPLDAHIIPSRLEAAAEGRDFGYECRFLMPSGVVKHLRIVAHGSRDREGHLEYIGAVQDLTELRLSEEALGKARSELAHVARATSLSALTASIAHEVNQPLSGIVTNASTCLRMLSANPPNIAGALETARRTIRDGNRASDVIQRLRALFANKGRAPEEVDLNDAIREVIALSRSELQRSQVIVRPEFADDLPPVTGDRVQLQQVVLNLLRNAADAMSEVNDRPRRLRIRTERDQADSVCLSVQDAGVGFEPQTADRLFDPFYTTKSDGMGMGLSVSRSIIESHHGRIWAQPNQGPGATFAFSIPRGPGANTPAGLSARRPA